MNKMYFYCFLPSFVNGFHGFFCHHHQMNRINREAGAMQCLAKSGASGVFYQQRITLITLILRAVRVICCSPLFIRFIWFIR